MVLETSETPAAKPGRPYNGIPTTAKRFSSMAGFEVTRNSAFL